MLVRAPGRFDDYTFDECLHRVEEEGLRVDLSRLTWATPYALVGLACLIDHAFASGAGLEDFQAPAIVDRGRYLGRMHLGQFIERGGYCHHGIPLVREHDIDTLHELQRFIGEDEADNVAELVSQRLAQTFGEGQIQRLVDQLAEIGPNAVDHSLLGEGIYAAQIYGGAGRPSVEFAIGDHGQGIKASLEGTKWAQDNDEAAIRKAAERGVSRHEKNRGLGLASTIQSICSLGGQVTIRSGTAKVFWSAGGTYTVYVPRMPGTIFFAKLPL